MILEGVEDGLLVGRDVKAGRAAEMLACEGADRLPDEIRQRLRKDAAELLDLLPIEDRLWGQGPDALGRLTPIEFETIMTTPASQAA